jgi:4-carboxymuconolactone decarboxylase
MSSTRYDDGLRIRREVLGAEHVDPQIEAIKSDDFWKPVQDLVTEFGWNDIWGRPELDRKTRSLITVALLACMNRQHELQGHLRGALRNGASAEQIREVMLHTAVYCGFPAALEGIRMVKKVFADEMVQTGNASAKPG